MKWVVGDFETASALDLKKVGAARFGYDDRYCGYLSDEIYEDRGDFDRAMKNEGFVVKK